MLGHRFSNLGQGLYPAIGLRSREEELCVNFSGPFRFDIDAYMREARDNVEVDIARHEVGKVPRILRDLVEGDEKDENGDQTMGVEVSSTHPVALLPVSSRTTAAFVLDYLQHNGFMKAFDSTRSDMMRRSWVPPATTTDTNQVDKLSLINQINIALVTPGSPIPLDLIGKVLPTTSPLHHRMSIYQLVYLIQQTHSSKNEEQEMGAIAYGRELRQRAKDQPWATGEIDLLEEAVGHLALAFEDASRTLWTQRRLRDTDLLDSHIRCESDQCLNRSGYLVDGCSCEWPSCAIAACRGYRSDWISQYLAGSERTSLRYVP